MATTSQKHFDAPRGRMPTLQFVPPGELQVDPSYQRGTEAGDSQALAEEAAGDEQKTRACFLRVDLRRLNQRGVGARHAG